MIARVVKGREIYVFCPLSPPQMSAYLRERASFSLTPLYLSSTTSPILQDPHTNPPPQKQACVVPRPIGWISTRSSSGTDNLAPYSQFTNLTFDPPYVMFSSNRTPEGKRKDTVINAESTGFFAWNLATYALREQMNITAQQLDPTEDEFTHATLEKEPAKTIPVPLVKASPVRFECQFDRCIQLPGNPPMGTVDIIFGKVLAVHISDSVLTDGKIDIAKTEPIARLGYYDYAVVRETFEMKIPGTNKALLDGLEGSSRANRELEGKEGKREQVQRSQSAGAGEGIGGGEEEGGK
jgi:flavin reductase (DIM6/NTAB) family NADH-FMN oxidoreductase RutF